MHISKRKSRSRKNIDKSYTAYYILSTNLSKIIEPLFPKRRLLRDVAQSAPEKTMHISQGSDKLYRKKYIYIEKVCSFAGKVCSFAFRLKTGSK